MSEFQKLREAIEKEAQRTLSTPSDFKWLSQFIFERTHERLSTSTLMRFWGYMDQTKPSKMTLNILARALGYIGYDDFIENKSDEVENREKSTVPFHIKQRTSQSRWIIWTIAALSVVFLAVIGFFVLKPSPKHVYITDIKQLSNTKQYLIHTRHKLRGSIGLLDRHLATTYSLAEKNRCEEASPFAIIKYKGDYYLYSVAEKRFIDSSVYENDAPCYNKRCALNIHMEADSCFVIDFKECTTVCSLNINSAYGPFVTDYGTINSMYDEGNMFMFEEIGDFDPTEALAMMEEPNTEYTGALKAVTPGHYVIYTEYNDTTGHKTSKASKSSVTKCYYLRADGCLTKTRTDSCIFSVEMVEERGDIPAYRLPAWRILYKPTVAKGGEEIQSLGFGVPNVEGNGEIRQMGHLRVDPASLNNWQDKILFLGKNGNYAIRGTNIPIETYGCGLYWSVHCSDGSGVPKAGYSRNREYVWKLKRVD